MTRLKYILGRPFIPYLTGFTILFIYWYFLPGFWEPAIDPWIQIRNPCDSDLAYNLAARYFFWKDLLLYIVLWVLLSGHYLRASNEIGRTLCLIAVLMVTVGIGALLFTGNIGDAIQHPAIVAGCFGVSIGLQLIIEYFKPK